jgi:PcfJ-like protein
MTAFAFRVDPAPRGFTVSATSDRAPVTVTLREWEWNVTSEDPWPGGDNVGLVLTRQLVGEIAERMCRPLFAGDRAANVRVKHGTTPRTARSIHHRVAAEVKRLHDQVPDEVLATQRAMFAATFGTYGTVLPELYRPGYAMLRRDIRSYRAAAAALACGRFLTETAAENAVKATPEFRAARITAERAGFKLSLGNPDPDWDFSPDDDSGRETAILDRLASGWLGVFSPTARPYRSLNRTLMNLPGGIPASYLQCLAGLTLPRPITDRVELLAVLTWYGHAGHHETARQYRHLLLHASRADVTRAMAMVSAATHVPLSPRRTSDIARTTAYLCDYPDGHAGSITGLARKSIAWHRETAEREAAETVSRLGGDKPATLPPLPLPGIPGITFLGTVARIAEEGALMGNCVASYAERAADGDCYLFHADHDGEMATIEVTRDGTVAQAEGPRNRPNTAARWARAALARWCRGFPETCQPALRDDPWAMPEDHQLAAAEMPF